MNTGYFPGIASIGNKIVGVENRDGNANVKTAQAETLERIYKSLHDNKIHVQNSRMDAGSYSKEIIEVVAKNSQYFYIRANKCEALTEEIRQITDWKTVEINFIEYQVASLAFSAFLGDKNYRLVIAREKTNDPQLDLFEGE
ncbi:MAG: IS1380 family transposase, partial [Bacteroidales bacterium]|nr:IS1380 family transposase [Bacteroidales bacterium]